MTENIAQAPAPHEQLMQITLSLFFTRFLYIAAKFGVADELAAGPRKASEIAAVVGADGPSLHRLMRSLTMIGVFTLLPDGRFGLTPLGEALKKDAPGSMHTMLLATGSPYFLAAFQEEMIDTLETGKPAFDKRIGMPFFKYLSTRPEDASLFSKLMVAFHGPEAEALPEAYDFSGVGTVVDLGGATGNVLSAILSRHSGPRGVLFDLPHVVVDAPALLESRDVADRVTIHPGDLFEAVPAGGDVYILSHIVHDWREDLALRILANCRLAMTPASRLLIVEAIMPDGDTPHPAKMMDMVMMFSNGGRERTAAEYGELVQKAGLKINRVVPTPTLASVIECSLA
jgi:O-methyltransferase domain